MAALPILTVCAGVNRRFRLLCDGATVEEFDTASEAAAALRAACSAVVRLGLIFHTNRKEA